MNLRGAVGWIPVALAVTLRLHFLSRVHEPPDLWMPDGSSYLTIARGILRGQLSPEAWIFPPGYPLCGAALSFVGGAGAGLLASSFLGSVLLVAAATLLGRWAGLPRAGFVAALILACHPDLVLAGVVPLSEATFLALLVTAAALLESGLRPRRGFHAVAGGVLAGLAVLTRPEAILAVALLVVVAVARRRVAVAGFATAAAVVVLPYVVALHSASGVWALSLKPYVFVPLGEVHESAPSYVEGRIRWERFWEATLDDAGAPDPRRLVAATSLAERFSPAGLAGDWIRNVGHAAARLSPAAWLLWVGGVAGLARPRIGAGRSRVLVGALAAPFLAAPFVQAPTGRFADATVPALAWGSGLLADRVSRAAARRWPPVARRALPLGGIIAALALTAWPLVALAPVARDYHWMGRQVQVQVELGLGRPADAIRTAREGIRIDPGDPRFRNVLGYLLEKQGDLAAAEEAYRAAVRLGGQSTGLERLLLESGRGEETGAVSRAERVE